jgi:hypothetical protein
MILRFNFKNNANRAKIQLNPASFEMNQCFYKKQKSKNVGIH